MITVRSYNDRAAAVVVPSELNSKPYLYLLYYYCIRVYYKGTSIRFGRSCYRTMTGPTSRKPSVGSTKILPLYSLYRVNNIQPRRL